MHCSIINFGSKKVCSKETTCFGFPNRPLCLFRFFIIIILHSLYNLLLIMTSFHVLFVMWNRKCKKRQKIYVQLACYYHVIYKQDDILPEKLKKTFSCVYLIRMRFYERQRIENNSKCILNIILWICFWSISFCRKHEISFKKMQWSQCIQI